MKKIMEYFFIVLGAVTVILMITAFIQALITIGFAFGWISDHWSTGEAMSFYSSIFLGIITLALGIITVFQTKKANELSNRIIDKELLEENCNVILQPKLDLIIKHNEDRTITISTNHRLDYGATIALEKNEELVDRFNEYDFKCFFKCKQWDLIKRIKIKELMCVQDPQKNGGLYWSDNSDDPIPCPLSIIHYDRLYINSISENKFYINIKIYSPINGTFSNMVENKVISCLMFNLIITSINNVNTEMEYRIWFSINNKNEINIIHSNSNLVNKHINKELSAHV